MSQHPSLRAGSRRRQQRSVLKRFERLRTMVEKQEWQPDRPVFGLPKLKVIRIKMKKGKAAGAEAGAAAPAQPGAAAAAAAKPAAGKSAPGKPAAVAREAKKPTKA